MNDGIKFYVFDSNFWTTVSVANDPFSAQHCAYLTRYLTILGCRTVIEESVYIDRDFHEEFSEFYGTTPLQPKSTCRRLHFFSAITSGNVLKAAEFTRYLSGENSIESLQESYLGCCVIRPEGIAPFGRTMLRCYPPHDGDKIRHFDPARSHDIHLAGLTLKVKNVPWQQQDEGVSACAGVSLWSLLQSVAPREGISVPTTTRVAKAAMRYSLPMGRALPPGLDIGQLCQGIREFGLAPVVFEGDLKINGYQPRFSPTKFRELAGLLVRSGLPVILSVATEVEQVNHAVLLIGFQEKGRRPAGVSGAFGSVLAEIPVVYLHDDNFGPGVRHEIQPFSLSSSPDIASLSPMPPNGGTSERLVGLIPSAVVGAFPQKLRLSPVELLENAYSMSQILLNIAEKLRIAPPPYVHHNAAFVPLQDYLDSWLKQTALAGNQLGRTIMSLQRLHPLPRYIGLVRLEMNGKHVLDVIFDTTTAPRRGRIVGWLAFDPFTRDLGRAMQGVRDFVIDCV